MTTILGPKDTAFVQKTDYVNLVRPCPGCGTLTPGYMSGSMMQGDLATFCERGSDCGPGAMPSLVSFDRFVTAIVQEIQERMAAGKIRNW